MSFLRNSNVRRNRSLQIESLENRELLSVSVGEFDDIKSQNADLNLTSFADYNIIDVPADKLTEANIRTAINQARNSTAVAESNGGKKADDLIVLRTTDTSNTITLNTTETVSHLAIDFDALNYGSVTIVAYGTKPLTIDANQKSRVFNITGNTKVGGNAKVGLANLTITGGSGAGSAGIHNEGSTLIVTNSTISGNKTGIYSRNNNNTATLIVTNSTISGNKGDGIQGQGLTVTGSIISENTDRGIRVNVGTSGTPTITNSIISENTGGGIETSGTGTLTVTGSIISGNTAGSGGGIFCGITTIVTDSIISGNTASKQGGGIYADVGRLTVIGSTISGNTITGIGGKGGGIYFNESLTSSTISDSLIFGNTANYGGGIYYDDNSRYYDSNASLIITNSAISYNMADDGGGIYNGGKKALTVDHSTISSNRGKANGGGIYSNQLSVLNVTDSVVADNSALNGGGIYERLGKTTTVTNSLIVNNAALGNNSHGGGFYDESGQSTAFTNSTIANNTSVGNGGGVYISGVVTIFNNSIIAENSSDIFLDTLSVEGYNNLSSYTDWDGTGNRLYDDSQPLFVDAAAQNYRLANSSQAIDSGSNTKATGINYDLDGHARIVNSTVDMGAYEYGGQADAIPDTPVKIALVNSDTKKATTDSIPLLVVPVEGATDYKVQVTEETEPTESDWTEVSPNYLFVEGTTLTVTGLTPDTEYQFRVSASNDKGDSAWSDAIAAATLTDTPPATPTDLSWQASTDTIWLFWVEADGAESYSVQAKGGDFGDTFVELSDNYLTFNGTSATVFGLEAGTGYSFQVQSKNVAGDSAWSAAVDAITIPEAPAYLGTGTVTSSTIDLEWSNYAVAGATGYVLQISTDGGSSWTDIGAANGVSGVITDTWATVTNLTPETEYSFQLQAVNAGGGSAWSATVTATTLADTPPVIDLAVADGTKITGTFTGKANSDYTFAVFTAPGMGDDPVIEDVMAYVVSTDANGKGTFEVAQNPALEHLIGILPGKGKVLYNDDDGYYMIVDQNNETTELEWASEFYVGVVPNIALDNTATSSTSVVFDITNNEYEYGYDDYDDTDTMYHWYFDEGEGDSTTITLTGELDGATENSTYTVDTATFETGKAVFLYKGETKTSYTLSFDKATGKFTLAGLASEKTQSFAISFPRDRNEWDAVYISPVSNTVTATTLADTPTAPTNARDQAVANDLIAHGALAKDIGWDVIDGKNRIVFIDGRGLSGAIDVSNCTALEEFTADGGAITSLNVSGCTELKELNVNYNQLTSLNVSGLTNLQTLGCGGNELTSLNVSGCTNLQELDCRLNYLTVLNVSGLTNLQYLHCPDNELTSLNVSSLTNLQTLGCGGNELTSLNVSGCTNLQELWCSGNELTSLNVSGCTNLQELGCPSNKLTALDVSSLTNLEYLSCYGNQLTTVYVPVGFKAAGTYQKDDNTELVEKAAPTAPAVPTGLAASAVTKDSLTLSWTAVDGVTYTLQQYSGTGWNTIVNSNAAGTMVSGLTANTLYQFRLKAAKDGLGSDYVTVTATTLADTPPVTPPAPAMPTDFVATPSTDSVTLTWKAVTGADSYVVQYHNGDGKWKDVPAGDISGTTATVKGLAAGTTYYFQVKAVNAGGKSEVAKTNATTTLTDTSKQQPPNNVKVDVTEGKETKSATITWTAPEGATDKTVYIIEYWDLKTPNKVKKVTVKAKAGLTKDLALKSGAEYGFRVSVKGVKGGKAASEVVEAGEVRAWDVVPSASLTALKAEELEKLVDFHSQNSVAVKVKNLRGDNHVGTERKSVEVNTLTVTYKNSKDKNGTPTEVVFTYSNGIWTSSSNDVTFKDGIIIIRGLTEAKAKYTVTARFGNLTEGDEAASVKATSKVLSTTKTNWQAVKILTATASASSGSVTWEAVKEYGSDVPATNVTYTVKLWYGGKAVKKLKAAGVSLPLTASQLKKYVGTSGLSVTVIANADKTHVAGIDGESVPVTWS